MNQSIQTFSIRSGETDVHHRLTLSALAEHLQDSAWQHSVERGVEVPRLLEMGVSWVLSRMGIEADSLPEYGQAVQLTTWVSSIDRFFYYREFRLVDAQTGERLLRATSVWGVLDMSKRRIIPVPDFIRERTATHNGPEPLPTPSGKLPGLATARFSESVRVRWSDLDANRHVNNTRYFGWLADVLPAQFLDKHNLHTLDIVFRAEATLGQQLLTEAMHEETATFLHAIRQSDGGEVVQARSVWQRV